MSSITWAISLPVLLPAIAADFNAPNLAQFTIAFKVALHFIIINFAYSAFSTIHSDVAAPPNYIFRPVCVIQQASQTLLSTNIMKNSHNGKTY
jgi:hypothetical protein